jgi:hypothetical protein
MNKWLSLFNDDEEGFWQDEESFAGKQNHAQDHPSSQTLCVRALNLSYYQPQSASFGLQGSMVGQSMTFWASHFTLS